LDNSLILFVIFARMTNQRTMPTIAYFPLGIAVMTWLGGVMT